ncbi:caspase-1 [Oryzias melastigma]|uniref:Caspase-1-like n=1 Tax=Oryzias melastigma TaxID=30732 RepID=A0A3B3C079_ORYME|nr:caspase-1 [Oryzias melastigma]
MADKELFNVRAKFVGKVSKPVLELLADDLLQDRVLNDAERESISEEKRREMACMLIDIVRKKGSKASSKMIDHLEKNDPSLFSELGLSGAHQPQKNVHPQSDEVTTSVLTIQDFWKTKQNDPEVYPVTKDTYKNRVALMITNKTFLNEKMNRSGAEKDEENMERLLSNLGYKVEKHTNLTGKDINEAFISFSKQQKLKQTDSVIVVLMSHGKLGAVLGVDEYEFPVNNIYEHLGSEKCPALLDKPKIIIIQACRGAQKGSVLVSDGESQAGGFQSPAAAEDLLEDSWRYVHKEKDFISLLSCTPDTVSYRQPDRGSILIQYIVDIFRSDANTQHIQELFRKVMFRFESFDVSNKRQMPTIDRTTVSKHFYFFPGLGDTNHS